MEDFDKVLSKATKNIDPRYFKLPTINVEQPKFRERVYCYELYHQMRCLWTDDTFCINGEVDKRIHSYFTRADKKPIPDFIIHIPGTDENYAVIEVKHASSDKTGIAKDVKTLMQFIDFAKYKRAIYLTFGDAHDEKTILDKIQEHSNEPNINKIEFWLHLGSGTSAKQVKIN